MRVYKVGTRKYYHLDDLLEEYPVLKIGFKSRSKFITKHGMDVDDYVHVKLDKKDEWVETSARAYKYGKFFVRIIFAKEHLIPWAKAAQEKLDKKNSVIAPLPPIIDLREEECMRDEDGNVLDIQVVGERDQKSAYFRVKDISREFGIRELKKAITYNKNEDGYYYEEGVHYRRYYSADRITNADGEIRSSELYLSNPRLCDMLPNSYKNKIGLPMN